MKERTTVIIVRESKGDSGGIVTAYESVGDKPSIGMARMVINHLLRECKLGIAHVEVMNVC